MIDHEKLYWIAKAALLDPNAYEYVYASNWSRTVPPGQPWLLLNGWFLDSQIGNGKLWFHRRLDVDHAYPMAEGTVFGAMGHQGFALWCMPDSITSDQRYCDDPKGLYYRRLDGLAKLPRFTVEVTIPINSTPGTWVNANFDNDFTDGMLLHTSTLDSCWTIIQGPGLYLNTLEEINDFHVQRFSGNTVCPFKRSQWSGIRAQSGNLIGYHGQNSTMPGHCVVHYAKLPAGW